MMELKDLTGADLPAMQARFAATAKNKPKTWQFKLWQVKPPYNLQVVE